MKIFFVFFMIIFSLKATVLDVSNRAYFCVYKDMEIGNLHLSVEFVSETEQKSAVQVK